ncbi:hypothetical protein BJ138DRAFT_283572 [Hygrophoropsis aurantiaca]|uniref:Uncharacterized protein n=1 Tax=Hygrophoropsis aurantiaca TaxID=72124 RepID=A0ACB8AVT5_9AGAM|nr:hypothetical protein BJ138DRAFT_283572 [Hygrophoropsis aurantiaca]
MNDRLHSIIIWSVCGRLIDPRNLNFWRGSTVLIIPTQKDGLFVTSLWPFLWRKLDRGPLWWLLLGIQTYVAFPQSNNFHEDAAQVRVSMSRSLPPEIIFDLGIVRTTSFASYVLLIWDIFLTIEDEITYIWGSPRSAAKVLYLCNRYDNLLVQPVSLAQTTQYQSELDEKTCFKIRNIRTLPFFQTCLAFVWIKSLSQFLACGSVQSMNALKRLTVQRLPIFHQFLYF